MQAVTFATFGPPDILSVADRPMPEPGAGEVVVRTAASTINPTDLLMRSGAQAAIMTALVPPYVAGMEFSGRIHAAGPGADMSVGAPVIGVVNPRTPVGGAHAQFVLVPAESVAILDPGVDLVAAATVPMNALTALLALEQVGLSKGGTVLVTGGTGMLGGSAIQLARLAGLRVHANGDPGDHGLLRALGADVVLPRDEGLAEALGAVCPGGVDALIDGALIGATVSSLVRTGGLAVSLRRSHPIDDPRLTCRYVSVIDGMGRTDLLRSIARHLKAGSLQPRVAENGVFDFRDAIAATRAASAPHLRGRVVLRFSA